MANWCNGTLKVRGSKEEVKNFLLGALEPNAQGLFNSIPVEKEIEEDDWSFAISAKRGFYVKGSRRNGVGSNIEFYFEDEKEEYVCVIDDYEAAWDIDVRALVRNSKEYNVDLKIYAFERGMEFNRDIEIHKGEVIKDDTITFNDYDWECIDPRIGG